jgi:hypothetical protein
MIKDLIWLRRMGCYLCNVQQNQDKMLIHFLYHLLKQFKLKYRKNKLTRKIKQ